LGRVKRLVWAVTRHLIELGHRQIAVITGPPEWRSRDDRVGGHLAALAEAGMLGDPELMRYGEPATKTGLWAGRELIDLRDCLEPANANARNPPHGRAAFDHGPNWGELSAL
jgi:DNA-binding LacI/PurR family transcriptional regulator